MTNRRTFLESIAATSLGLAGLPLSVRAQQPTKIGTILPLSGPLAGVGRPSEMGAKLALKAMGREFGINTEYISIDSEGNPGRALPKVLAVMQREGVKLFSGSVLSSVGLALSSQVATSGGIFITGVGADEITGSQCRRSTFRWTVPSYGAIQETIRPLMEMFPDAKRWYTITPKYVFGEALLRHAVDLFKAKGVEHVGNSYHSLAETEFSGYVANAAAAKPDVLVLLNFGGQATNTLRQAADFGLKSKMKILMAWDAGLEQYQEIGSDVLDGVYTGTQYYHEIDSPGNRRIVKLFEDEYKRVPSYSMLNVYMCNELLMRGIKAAGSAEPAAMISALEGMSYEGPTGTEKIQPFDHQCVKNYYLGRGKAKARKRNDNDFIEILSHGKSFLPAAETGCKFT